MTTTEVSARELFSSAMQRVRRSIIVQRCYLIPSGLPASLRGPGKERSANVERSPDGWHSRRRVTGEKAKRRRTSRAAGRVAAAFSVAAALGVAVPASVAGSASASPRPTLKELLAAASKLSRQIDSLSQQYDALRIQFSEAKSQVKIAKLTVRRDERLLATAQTAIAHIAAAGYMTGGVDPAISLLASKNPQSMLNRASILGQLQKENGDKVRLVTAA